MMLSPRPLNRSKSVWSIYRRFRSGSTSELTPPEKTYKTPISHKYSKIPMPLYGGRYVVTMITAARSIGPELMAHILDIFHYASIPVDFEYLEANSMKEVEDAIGAIKRNGTAIKSNIEKTSAGVSDGSPNVILNQSLDLYMNIIHCKPYCALPNIKFQDADIVLIRQNTEGEYAMLEHESVPGVIESLKVITKENSDRLAHRAFEFALVHKRKKVTIVNKANIMKLSDGLFLKRSKKVAKQYPGIETDAMIVDNCCMQLVSDPKQFDVLLMPNLYGSIIRNIICGILGGPGLFAGCNYGEYYAIFEPATRTSATDIVGKNIANPISMLNASVELLYHLRLDRYADLLTKAIFNTLCKDKIHTRDLGGKNTSTEVVDAIKRNVDVLYKFTF